MKVLLTLALLLFVTGTSAQSDTTSLDETPIFKKMPCDLAEHRSFDFWVGSWRVTSPDGKHAGDSKIVAVEDGCVIRENWTSATSKYTGTSYNFYNKNTSQWEQIWLDNQGGVLHLRGKSKGNTMVLGTDKQVGADGKTTYNQITWTKNEDGSVRQLWHVFTVGAQAQEAQEAQVAFDGLYTASK